MNNSQELQKKAKAELAKRELARRHLKDFASYIYEGYIANWHIEILCEALEEVEKGNIRFLMVEMPPRHSKSLHVSQLFPAWVFGRDKNNTVIVSSYSGDLATDHGRETRNIMETQKYTNIFDTKLAQDSTAKGKFHTNGKGAYNASGVGGSITGKGARFFIVDDPFKDRKEVDSVLIRDDRWRWLKSVARTRLTPDGAMIVMHTRWHEDDIIGRIHKENEVVSYFDWKEGKRGEWVELCLPAIAEQDEPFRKKDEALWANHFSLDELTSIKKDIGGYEWSALYQQNPVDEENRVFKPEWFRYKDVHEISDKQTANYMTIDTKSTNNATGGSDYIGICINQVDKENNWYLRASRYKISAKDLVDMMFNYYEVHNLMYIGIEKTAFTEGLQSYLENEMRIRNKFLPIVELKHGGTKKNTRIEWLAPRYERGAVYHLKQGGMNLCADLEEELLSFPVASNDDVSDATAYQTQIAEARETDEDDELGIY